MAGRRASGGGPVKPRRMSQSSDGPPSFKSKVWALVDDPTSSAAANVIAVVIMGLIGVSCISFCVETLPALRGQDQLMWFIIEAVCITLFTIEFLVRLFSTPDLCAFSKDALNIIDLIAIVPFYVELLLATPGDDSGGGASAVFRVVRLIRVFRVLKISRYVSWVKVFGLAMKNSAQPLGMLLFVMGIGTIVFSSAMYFAERGEFSKQSQQFIRSDGTPSPFQSIPAAFWWCVVTMTTVGYGDDYPITSVGKILAAVTSLCGVLVLAIPITVISANFNQEYNKSQKRQEAVRSKMMLFKHQFEKQRPGLPAIKHEIDALIKRNTAELTDDLQALVAMSREEMGSSIMEVVKLAYKARTQKLESQLRAGALDTVVESVTDTGDDLVDDTTADSTSLSH